MVIVMGMIIVMNGGYGGGHDDGYDYEYDYEYGDGGGYGDVCGYCDGMSMIWL